VGFQNYFSVYKHSLPCLHGQYVLSNIFWYFKDNKKLRDTVPENNVASLQEELAAVKLREAEANLALKDLKAKVLLKIKQTF